MRKRFFRPAFCTFIVFTAMCVSSLTGCTGLESEQETSEPTATGAAMQLNKASFGSTPDGRENARYTLTNKNGVSVAISNDGAIVTSVVTPDKNGVMGDAALGFPSTVLQPGETYKESTLYKFPARNGNG